MIPRSSRAGAAPRTTTAPCLHEWHTQVGATDFIRSSKSHKCPTALHTPIRALLCVRVFVLCVRVCDYGCAGSCTVVMGRTTASKLKQTCCYRLGRDVWEMSQGVWIAASPMRLETLALCALNSASPVAWKCIIYSLPVCLPCLRSHVLVPFATVVLCTSVLGGRYRVLRPSISKRCSGPDRPVQRCGRGM